MNIRFSLCHKKSEFPIKQKESLASSTKSAACQAQCRLRHLSGGIMVAWPLFKNEIAPPCIMLRQTGGPVSRFSPPFRCPVYIPYGIAVLPWRYLRSAPGLPARSGSIVRYSVFTTPISAPQCQHFMIKSGCRPFFGVTNLIFVSNDTSITLRPHFGHPDGRILFFIS